MNRLSRRRLEREMEKRKTTVYQLTAEQIEQIKRSAMVEAAEVAFTLMLALPLEVLSSDGYWPKTAKRRIPKFLNDLLDLYDSWEKGVLSMDELRKDLKEIGGLTLEPPKGTEKF